MMQNLQETWVLVEIPLTLTNINMPGSLLVIGGGAAAPPFPAPRSPDQRKVMRPG
jgi:hypothetical protein